MAIMYVNLFKMVEMIFISRHGISIGSDIMENTNTADSDPPNAPLQRRSTLLTFLPEVIMASDSIKRISEAEERALQIEREADSSAAAMLADAENAARGKAANLDSATDEDVCRILTDAEEARLKTESDALRLAALKSEDLRTDISPRMPAAVAAVRDLIIGKV